MKNTFAILFALIVFIPVVKSQDLITKKTGEDISSKVVEINLNEVKYKKWDNQDGPLISISKSDILMIRYQNGTKDLFNNENVSSSIKEVFKFNKGEKSKVIDTYSHSALISPGSLILGTANLRYEKITKSNLSYGARIEANFLDNSFDKHLWVIPYGRLFPFNKEQNGLYFELGLGYRARYEKSENWSEYTDWFKSAVVARTYLGIQWFAGKKYSTPIDIGIGLNIDTQNGNLPEEAQILAGIFGPLSVFSFRLQTGLCFN